MQKILMAALCAGLLAGCVQSEEPDHMAPVESGPGGAAFSAPGPASTGDFTGAPSGGSYYSSPAAAGVPVPQAPRADTLGHADEAAIERSMTQALGHGQSGQAVDWHSPVSGHHGTIVPQPAYETGGTYCRAYEQTAVIGGQTQRTYGRACRQSDGSWRVVS